MRFAKWHGAGNDFLLFFPEDLGPWQQKLPQLAKLLCHRQLGLGADGLLVLEPCGEATVRVRYLNRDGSPASFCANGSRCAAAFAAKRLGRNRLLLLTDFAPIPAAVGEGEVTLELPAADKVRGWLELPVGEAMVRGFALTVGVPHLVVPVGWEPFWTTPLLLAPALRAHPLLAPEGANVHFARVVGKELWIRSFERGVEGETLACGSGAVAAAAVAVAEDWASPPVAVKTASGRYLKVRPLGPRPFDGFHLTGPAEPLAWGEVAPQLLAGVDSSVG